MYIYIFIYRSCPGTHGGQRDSSRGQLDVAPLLHLHRLRGVVRHPTIRSSGIGYSNLVFKMLQ